MIRKEAEMKNESVFDETIELKANAMLVYRPELFNEWDFEKNDELGWSIYKMTKASTKIAWWNCPKCETPYDMSIESRILKKSNCPYCRGYRVNHTNSLASLFPNFVQEWHPTLNGELTPHDIPCGTAEIVWWKCPDCDNIIKNKSINNISNRGISCPRCSDDVSFGERFIYNLLKENSIEFEFDVAQDWSKGKRYDFYFEYKGTPFIIEVHGIQHYEQSRRGRSLKEEQENDRLKESLARENSITNYIVIDARESTIEWISNSIINSNIMKIIDHADFEKIGRLSSKSFIKVVCDLWLSGIQNTSEIAKIIKLSQSTIATYLKRGAEIGWCDYQAKKGPEYTKIALIKLTVDNMKISEYKSISDAKRENNYSNESGIVRACQGRTLSYDGFKWMYKEDYELFLETGIVKKQHTHIIPKKERPVIMLDSKANLVKQYPSVQQAAEENSIKRNNYIFRCCRGERNVAGGYGWMYKEDYDKMIKEKLSHEEYMNKRYPKKTG